ncbi:TPR end-of-group domain-containing protein [Coleofasciculus sp.]|uniref:TPR end-of-group domain-containing protein n=1 Tax=Coleofasciculus sp. TaxID=3100458 RepID=UPI0039F74B80
MNTQRIYLNPDKCREIAKTDSVFNSIREDQRFQALIVQVGWVERQRNPTY